MAINAEKLLSSFPKTKFAFYGDYINRYKPKLLKKKVRMLQLIYLVYREFHNWT